MDTSGAVCEEDGNQTGGSTEAVLSVTTTFLIYI